MWVLAVVVVSACSRIAPDRAPGAHIFLWAGDADGKASDFLGVIDADPASAGYGAIVASLPTGMTDTHPHHTEHEMPAGNQLLANLVLGEDEEPHWVAIDPTGRRIVLNSGGYAKGNRLFIINFDPATGKLSLDDTFRDAGSARAGIDLTGKIWPHGFTGRAQPHGTVFSR
jgi:hypothetical protein